MLGVAIIFLVFDSLSLSLRRLDATSTATERTASRAEEEGDVRHNAW
jgi:hypothetical protein